MRDISLNVYTTIRLVLVYRENGAATAVTRMENKNSEVE